MPFKPTSASSSAEPHESSPETHPAPPRRAWQFSLQTLLIATTAIAVGFWAMAFIPLVINQVVIGAAEIALAGVLFTGIVFARGDQRAFCIGAAVVVSSMWTGVGARLIEGLYVLITLPVDLLLPISGHQGVYLWLKFLLVVGTAAANGWLCVRARRYFGAHSK